MYGMFLEVRVLSAILLKDANARYIFEDDEHSGSLADESEQILAEAGGCMGIQVFEVVPSSQAQLFQEYDATRLLPSTGRQYLSGGYLTVPFIPSLRVSIPNCCLRVHHPGSCEWSSAN